MTRTLAVAALAAAALALEAAFLHAAVAAPLARAVGSLAERARPATFEEEILVAAPRSPRRGGTEVVAAVTRP